MFAEAGAGFAALQVRVTLPAPPTAVIPATARLGRPMASPEFGLVPKVLVAATTASACAYTLSTVGRVWQLRHTAAIALRERCQSGRCSDTSAKSHHESRWPTSWVVAPPFRPLRWQVAQVGTGMSVVVRRSGAASRRIVGHCRRYSTPCLDSS